MKDVMKSRKNLIGYKDNPIGLFPLKVDLQFVSLLASREAGALKAIPSRKAKAATAAFIPPSRQTQLSDHKLS